MENEMTDIYHITPGASLESIIQAGGLWCDAQMHRRKIGYQRIGYAHIKTRRMSIEVPVAPHGVLADYVPFYFASRSPMLYVINQNRVPGYADGQNPIVHLVAEVEHLDRAYVFTDRHAAVAWANFYNDLANLDTIDWNVMQTTWWRSTAEDPDRMERRQAEFLVHQFVPWQAIKKIGVRLKGTQQAVNAIINSTGIVHKPEVEVESGWYY